MSIRFMADDIWPQLTKAARTSKQRCDVAVAYLGVGASGRLPLPKGSRLVVDASERAVASGQTCPAELRKLLKRGVRVFSIPNLHAKVFVLGRAAFIGSANVSNRSASQLVEAVIRTTEVSVVRSARDFVHKHCLHELTPGVLKELAKLYRPPIVPGIKLGAKVGRQSSRHPILPRLLMAQLYLGDWTEREELLHKHGLPLARKRRVHPRTFLLDSFINTGRCPYQRGDVVIQVTDLGGGKVLMAPPGNVLLTKSDREGSSEKTSVYIERPSRRCLSVKSVARTMGRGALKQLKRNGAVRNAAFAQALLKMWSQ